MQQTRLSEKRTLRENKGERPKPRKKLRENKRLDKNTRGESNSVGNSNGGSRLLKTIRVAAGNGGRFSEFLEARAWTKLSALITACSECTILIALTG